MTTLIIAEKPSVARDLARIVGAKSKPPGGGYMEGNGYRVSWAIGHLLELQEPDKYSPAWKRWKDDTLPMLPEGFVYRPRRGGSAQLGILKRLIRDRDVRFVVNACDAGREGELIFRLIWDHCTVGMRQLPTAQRLWISSLTDQAIRDGLNRIQPISQFDSLADAARCRSEADWLVGMNGTRATTLLGRRAGGTELMSVGRVQTPTLAMVCARERAIQAFIPEAFWQVRSKFDAGRTADPASATRGGPQTYEGLWFKAKVDRFKTREEAEEVRDAVRGRPARVVVCERKDTRQPPPLLYDLTTLQKTANRRFGFSADRTLKIAQALYDKHKAITYPRTDSRFLTPDMRPQFPGLAQAVNRGPWAAAAQAALASGMRAGSRVIRPSAVTDHHAIIPTLKAPAAGRLSADEERVYDLIVRRFLASFLPDVVFAKTKLVTEVDTEHLGPQRFVTHGKVRREEGWHLAEPPPKRPPKPKPGAAPAAASLPNVSKGDQVAVIGAETRESTTQPPSRYNEATLLSAMEGAGKVLDDQALRDAMRGGGLGTPATRAAIIETLLRREYIRRQKTALLPTPGGLALIDALPNDALRSPELTGRWEARLAEMASGQGEPRSRFMAAVADFTTTLVRDIQAAAPPEAIATAAAVVMGRCPVCGKDVTAGRSAYNCASGRDCTFVIMRQIARRKTSPGLVRLLLGGGRSQKLRGFRSKKGKSFSACLRLDAEGKVVFEFDDGPSTRPTRTKARAGNKAKTKTKPTTTPSKPPSTPRTSTSARAPKSAGPPKAALCPQCRLGRIMSGRRGWGCTRWREGCGFVVWFEQGTARPQVRVPADEADRLFRKKQTRLMDGLVPGRKARLVLDLEEEGNVRVELGKRS